MWHLVVCQMQRLQTLPRTACLDEVIRLPVGFLSSYDAGSNPYWQTTFWRRIHGTQKETPALTRSNYLGQLDEDQLFSWM